MYTTQNLFHLRRRVLLRRVVLLLVLSEGGPIGAFERVKYIRLRVRGLR